MRRCGFGGVNAKVWMRRCECGGVDAEVWMRRCECGGVNREVWMAPKVGSWGGSRSQGVATVVERCAVRRVNTDRALTALPRGSACHSIDRLSPHYFKKTKVRAPLHLETTRLLAVLLLLLINYQYYTSRPLVCLAFYYFR